MDPVEAADPLPIEAPAAPTAMGARLRRIIRHSLTRFLFFSGLGYGFDVTVLTLLEFAGWLPLIPNILIAFVLTYTLNFFLNRTFAFDAAHQDVTRQLGKFIPQVSVDLALTLGATWFLTEYVGLPVYISRTLAAFTNLVFNYTMYRFWTFRTFRLRPFFGRRSSAG